MNGIAAAMEVSLDRQIQARLEAVRARIEAAARRAGRPAGAVRLMAVTKTFPRAVVEAALRGGLRLFGENRVQEAVDKYRGLPEPVELHLIGHLQRNKAKAAASTFTCVQSIDKLETALALDRFCRAGGRSMDILLEVNTSGEESKSGFRSEGDLLAALDGIRSETRLTVRGLMTVGPFTREPDPIRRAFVRLRELSERLRGRYPDLPLDTLSMGMSGDFEAAVEEGATLVRLGTALFGSRPAAGEEGMR